MLKMTVEGSLGPYSEVTVITTASPRRSYLYDNIWASYSHKKNWLIGHYSLHKPLSLGFSCPRPPWCNLRTLFILNLASSQTPLYNNVELMCLCCLDNAFMNNVGPMTLLRAVAVRGAECDN